MLRRLFRWLFVDQVKRCNACRYYGIRDCPHWGEQ